MSSGVAVSLPRLVNSLRSRKLQLARWILIIIGAIMACGSVVLFLLAEAITDMELARQHVVLTDEERQLAIWIERLFQVGQGSVGLALIVLGILIYRAPVFCTVTGMSLYASHWAVAVVLGGPVFLAKGLLARLFVIAVLAKAIQTAFACRRFVAQPGQKRVFQNTT